jgi:hypothetical protein
MHYQPHAPQIDPASGAGRVLRFNLVKGKGPFGETVDLPLEANEYGMGGESVGGPISL